MTTLLDHSRRKRGAIRPAPTERRRILPEVADRVEGGQVQGQSNCRFCNRHKGTNLSGIDRQSKRIRVVRLFNPRHQQWSAHFAWDGPLIVGRTSTGRATIAVLRMNDPVWVRFRSQLLAEGWNPDG